MFFVCVASRHIMASRHIISYHIMSSRTCVYGQPGMPFDSSILCWHHFGSSIMLSISKPGGGPPKPQSPPYIHNLACHGCRGASPMANSWLGTLGFHSDQWFCCFVCGESYTGRGASPVELGRVVPCCSSLISEVYRVFGTRNIIRFNTL